MSALQPLHFGDYRFFYLAELLHALVVLFIGTLSIFFSEWRKWFVFATMATQLPNHMLAAFYVNSLCQLFIYLSSPSRLLLLRGSNPLGLGGRC